MAKAKAVGGALKTLQAGNKAQKAAKGAGLVRTGLTAAAASAVTRAFNNSDQNLEQSANQAGEVIAAAVERPVTKPKVSSDIPQATLAFTEYVKNQAERVEPIRAIGKPLPELVISRKFSPIIKNIITNINGIKERLERVEIKTRKQTTVLLNLKTAAMGLNGAVKDSMDQERRAELEEKRDKDEENIEKRGIGNMARNVFGRVSNFAGRIKDGILAALLPFLTPAALFGTSFALEQAQEFLPEEAKALEFEDVLNIVNTVEEKVAGVAAAFIGLAQGRNVANVATKIPTIQRAGTAVAQVVSKLNPGSAVYARFLPALQRVQSFFARISKLTGGITAAATKWLSGLGQGAADKLRKFGRGVLKWYLIFEAFQLMITAAQLLIMGTIDEAEFHKRAKAQIAQIVRVLGAPYLLMVIFGFLGTVVPLLGNAVGAVAGFIAGLFLGDKAFEILKLETLSNGLYNWFFLDDTTELKSFPPALLRGLAIELPALLGQAIAENYERVTAIADSVIADRMATEEEITSKFGADASDLDILRQATEGGGTDENALLYAFRNIKSTSDYLAFKDKFETQFLPEYNKDKTLGKVDTMEEYLRKELLTDEYEQLVNQVRAQIAESSNIEQAKLSEFIREITGVDDRPQILNYGGATEEEFKLWKAGQIVAVTTTNGGRKLMTEEQILTSDEVGIAARKSALERLHRNKRMAEAQGITYEPQPNQETNVVPVTRNQQTPSVLLIPPPPVGPVIMNNLGGTEGPVMHTTATPTRLISDSFIDVAYLT